MIHDERNAERNNTTSVQMKAFEKYPVTLLKKFGRLGPTTKGITVSLMPNGLLYLEKHGDGVFETRAQEGVDFTFNP